MVLAPPMKTPGSAEYDPPVPSLIPSVGQPQWKRTIKTHDVLPSPPPPVDDSDDAVSTASRPTTQSSSSLLRKGQSTRPTRPLGKPSGPLIVEIDPVKEQCPDLAEQASAADRTASASTSAPPCGFPLCSTCQTTEGRYTCPRCSAPYCSVDCYRIHDVPESTRSDGEQSIPGGGRCTESFYRNRVEGITKLDIKGEDNSKAMRNILARSAVNSSPEAIAGLEGSHGTLSAGEDIDNSLADDMNNAAAAVTDEELLQLAEAMLGLDDGDAVDDTVGILLESLPPHVREAFEKSVQDGEMSHLVTPWKPWWEAELSPLPDDDNGVKSMPNSGTNSSDIVPRAKRGDAEEQIVEEFLPTPPTFGPSGSENEICSGPTLDDRIVGIKRLHRGKPRSGSLHYNAVDIMFGVACTLRLYNGIPKQPTTKVESNVRDLAEQMENEFDSAIGAAETLLCSSRVLENDTRFTSIEEVMPSCSESAIRLSKMNLCNSSWSVLSQDLVAILANGRRGVLRALLDGKDILRCGSKAAKLHVAATATKTSGGGEDASPKGEQLGEAQKRYKLAQKKIEFYLSWCLEYWGEIQSENLTEAAKDWVTEWGQVTRKGGETLSIVNASPTIKRTVRIAR